MVEDSSADALLCREALQESHLPTRLSIVSDGVEALDYLRRRGAYPAALRPDLILLDLNLPRKNGLEVLQEIKADPDLKRIPVVVLSTSTADEDVSRSYGLQASCYLAKPSDFDGFCRLMSGAEELWAHLRLPPR
ncbi:MAG: response regulator [Candidatus Eremiobacterota bacterium]